MKSSIFISVIVFSLVFVGFSTSFGQEESTDVVCDWDDGKISDSQFLRGVEDSIENKTFMIFEFVQSDKYYPNQPIPDSVKNTVSLYCQGKAGGIDLENAISLLFDEGLLKVDVHNILKVEKKNYDRPYSVTTTNVKLFGQLEDKILVEKIIFRVIYPDGHTEELSVVPSKDGYFENYLIIDKKSSLGTYMVSAYDPFGVYLGSVKYDLFDKEKSQGDDETKEPKSRIPDWIKNTMQWYLDGAISEDEMITAIQFLVKEGIIKLD